MQVFVLRNLLKNTRKKNTEKDKKTEQLFCTGRGVEHSTTDSKTQEENILKKHKTRQLYGTGGRIEHSTTYLKHENKRKHKKKNIQEHMAGLRYRKKA